MIQKWGDMTSIDVSNELISNHFLKKTEGETGVSISACYQCERCTNACPAAHFMDIKPHAVIRYVTLGFREELLRSSTIWVCLSCEMCTTYCPNEVDVAKVIIYMRNMAARSSITPGEPALASFHRAFIDQLMKYGRINEFNLMRAYGMKPEIMIEKLKTGDILNDMKLAYEMGKRGRLSILPNRSRAVRQIREINKNR